MTTPEQDFKPGKKKLIDKPLGGIGITIIIISFIWLLDEANRLKLSAAMGSSKAMYDLGILIMRRHPNDINPGVKWLVKAAEHGNTHAMYDLPGYGGHPDTGKIKWFLKGAEAGNIICMYKVGEAYQWGGYGVQKDPRKGEYWLRKYRAINLKSNGYTDDVIIKTLNREFGNPKWPENTRPDLSNIPPP